MILDAPQADRAAGVLVGLACGDALGAPYEFGPPLAPEAPVGMVGGGDLGWAPGEWTDDTQMSVVVLEAAETAVRRGVALTDVLDDVARGWVAWSATARDVGIQTSRIIEAVARDGTVTADGLRAAARDLHERTGRSGGNGSLMRTAPVALAHLHDEAAMVTAAREVSELTHVDPDAGDACVLWCAALRRAVLDGVLDVRSGLDLLGAGRRDLWARRLDEAEAREPADFTQNGWVVEALQAAWSAITVAARAAGPDAAPTTPLVTGLEAAVRGGRDADTVAAIAGALIGARWGASAAPAAWLDVVHGWPGLRVAELGERGLALARGEARA
ncbi:ADP-ribosylglycohydrolase family protein [Actinotalea solisilvae]|uniref:ADP-ribosylglycohydrolase family protein n=1 Tax=Actinotalea solisilvae TaxID=2072922 RepID=UPI0018F23821|nr:ADP-ribosylglycohydrolase family protein [Actinotalea solisilvae]